MYTPLLFTFWGFFGVVEMWEWGGGLVRARGRGKEDVTREGGEDLLGLWGSRRRVYALRSCLKS